MIAAIKSTRLNRPRLPRLALSDHQSACVIRQRGWRSRHTGALEAATTAAGALMLAGAVVLWVLPGSDNGLDVAPLKLLVTTTLLLGAAVLARCAGRGLQHEVHFDFDCRDMVQVLRNANGRETVTFRAAFDEIERLFIQPDSGSVTDGHLMVQLRGTRRPVLIGSDKITALEYLEELLSTDIRAGQRTTSPSLRKRVSDAFSARLR